MTPLPGAPVVITPAMRDGILHAAARLDTVALATRDRVASLALAHAAAALREEVKTLTEPAGAQPLTGQEAL